MPFVQSLVFDSNTDCSQSKPNWLFIQSLSLTAIVQFNDISVFLNHAVQWVLPAKITIEGSTQPDALMVSIAVTHSQFPGCTKLEHEHFSAWIITFVIIIIPIAKSVSSKL